MFFKLMKYSIFVFIFCLSLLLIFMLFIKIKSLVGEDTDLSLAIRWEGFYHDMNYRDLGESINECYGEQIIHENMVSRSAGWFSGWSCEKIGSPDVLYSLNFSPQKNEHFFCSNPDNKLIGKSFNQKTVLTDLEFIENWDNPEIRKTTCSYIDNIFSDIIAEKKVHIHCDAGRDRAGRPDAGAGAWRRGRWTWWSRPGAGRCRTTAPGCGRRRPSPWGGSASHPPWATWPPGRACAWCSCP